MTSSQKREWLLFGSLFLTALLLRLFYWNNFYGWEESDYGNLAMVQGVYDSAFTSYDMNHMPGFYALSALVHSVVNDTVIASKSVALFGGMAAFGLTVFLARRICGTHVAFVTGLLLIVQPEFSLYSASALREPLYSAFLMGLLFGFYKEKGGLAFLMAMLAFSVRFEAPLACFPLLIYFFFKVNRRVAIWAFLGFCLAVLLWSFYCFIHFDTPKFWAHATAVNLETGLGLGEREQSLTDCMNKTGDQQFCNLISTKEWVVNGLTITMSLFFDLLPSRVGWLVFGAWLLSPFFVDRKSKLFIPVLLSYGLVFVWLMIAFFAQHEPVHNLYWKWLMPFVPLVTLVGVANFALLIVNVKKQWQIIAWVVLGGQALFSHTVEAQRQIKRAQKLYKPQVELAKKIECNALTDRQYLIDNIPACWIRRQQTDLNMISWFDVDLPSTSQDDFASYLEDNNIAGVLWFRENWTQAPLKAPFLADGQNWNHNGIELTVTAKDLEPDGYGWIFYERKDSVFKPMPNCD